MYAIAVLPVNAGGLLPLEYQVEASSSSKIQELPATGVPIAGQADWSQYRRYRVVVGEADRHLSIALVVLAGDADLYVGLTDAVSEASYVKKSEIVGSDSIFLSAFGKINKEHCSSSVLKAQEECAYYIAVKGSTLLCEYRISATV